MMHVSRWVPVEPTEAMLTAGFNCVNYGTTVTSDIERAWSAMLEAAPSFVPSSSKPPPHRDRYAPGILAALVRQPHTNDDNLVARAVSLADKLYDAIRSQP